MAEGHLRVAPIFEKIEEFKGSYWLGRFDGITAGFPCQALLTCLHTGRYSSDTGSLLSILGGILKSLSHCQGASRAGSRLGLLDPRTSLVSHLFRLLDETQAQLALTCLVSTLVQSTDLNNPEHNPANPSSDSCGPGDSCSWRTYRTSWAVTTRCKSCGSALSRSSTWHGLGCIYLEGSFQHDMCDSNSHFDPTTGDSRSQHDLQLCGGHRAHVWPFGALTTHDKPLAGQPFKSV